MTTIVTETPCKRCGDLNRYLFKNDSPRCVSCHRAKAITARTKLSIEERRARSRKKTARRREHYNAKARAWRLANPEKQKAAEKRWREQHPEHANRWLKGDPAMRAARNVVYRALKSGLLVRPKNCSACGRACKPEGAHADYNRPLEVRWLCTPCHRKWDAREPKSVYSARARTGQ